MTRLHIKTLAGLVVLAGIAGCASPEPGSPAAIAAAEKEKQEVTQDQVKTAVAEQPDWFAKPPHDAANLYATGTAASGDMQLAMDEAILSAKRSLADQVGGLISGKFKLFLSESGSSGDAGVGREVEQVTSDVIDQVNVGGYRRTQSKLIPEGQHYRAYVLLEFPVDAANHLVVDRVKKDGPLESQLRASKAFEELEKDIKDAREHNGVTETQ